MRRLCLAVQEVERLRRVYSYMNYTRAYNKARKGTTKNAHTQVNEQFFEK